MPDTLATAVAAALVADDQALERLVAVLAPRVAARDERPAGQLSAAQAAARAGVHERTVRRALASQTLVGSTIARRWRIQSNDLDEWIARGAPTRAEHLIGNGRTQRRGNGTAGAAAIAAGAAAIAAGAARRGGAHGG